MSESEDSQLLKRFQNDNNAPDDGDSKRHQPVIIAMGVGGGGSNAVKHMFDEKIQGVDFVILNTDAQALNDSKVPNKILLGPQTTRGRGAGGKPELGRAAAEESIPDIEKFLEGEVDMVFITAGEGGGTGTGAAPVVAEIAKKKGILTIGIVTIPFFFEGPNKIAAAIEGAKELKKNVDALLVINNERLMEIYPDLAWDKGFEKADDILTTAARSISDTVTTPGMINIDMRDVDSTLREGRTALISVGYGEGENRMQKAIEDAIHSPLLCDTDIMSAKRLLFAFYYSHDIDPPFRNKEAAQANSLVAKMSKSVNTIFGWGFDDSLGNKVKFTLIAAGFDISVDALGEHFGNIEGAAENPNSFINDPRIRQIYGAEKVDNIERERETQNYFILDAEDLDSDDAIARIESTPTYNRNNARKKATETPSPTTKNPDDSPNSSLFS